MTALVASSASCFPLHDQQQMQRQQHDLSSYQDAVEEEENESSTDVDGQDDNHIGGDDDDDDDDALPLSSDDQSTTNRLEVVGALLQLKDAQQSQQHERLRLTSTVDGTVSDDDFDVALDEALDETEDETNVSFTTTIQNDTIFESPTKTDFSSFSTPLQSPVAPAATFIPTTPSSWALFPPLLTSSAAKDEQHIPYGGLSNLGNTCYMAAGIQMLCSLESFAEALASSEPPPLPSEQANLTLRTAFLELVERLRTTTVIPDKFKDALDERSPLFLGFRQQDSHEFLTTLLDLLDEDYKQKESPNSETKEDLKVEDAMDVQEEEEMELCTATNNSTDEPTASKKPRTDRISPMEADVDPACTPQPSTQMDESSRSNKSFSNLDVAAIGRLLHGDDSTSSMNLSETPPGKTSNPLIEVEQPHYKLLGGRMNTADVALTPYGARSAEYEVVPQTQMRDRVLELPNAGVGSTGVINNASTTSNNDTRHDAASKDDTENDESPEVETPISSMFMTKTRVRLTCDSCKYTRCHKESFLHLSLEIDSTTTSAISPNSIEDGLRRFFAPCKQEIKCEKCFCETATQTTEITQLPSALLLHLKRFIVDISGGWMDISYRKDQSAVHFDESLTLDKDVGVLSEFLASDCAIPEPVASTTNDSGDDGNSTTGTANQGVSKRVAKQYALRSVANHIGSSATSGHYTADAKRLYGSNGTAATGATREWTRFNDELVYKISSMEAVDQAQHTAYMCLYELEG